MSDVAVASEAEQVRRTESRNGPRELPAWPALVLLWGLPVWWLLGLMPFSVQIMAAVMLPLMLLRGGIVIVPGAWPWILAVLWMIPAAISLDSGGRIIAYALRFATFAGLAIVLVYVLNTRALTARRILSALTASWVTVIAGGYLGLLLPTGRLTRTVGVLLPDTLAQNDYIRDLLFPPFADIQLPWGADEPYMRPSAPFTYTNGWGAAMTVLTFAAIAAAVERRSRRAFVWTTIGIAASIPPAIQTSNRGLFVAVGIGVVYLAVRLLGRRQWAAAIATGLAVILAASVLLSGGALEAINDRQGVANTTEGRGNVYLETLQRALESPVLGYSSARPSAQSEIYLGTQGAVWSAVFCFGFVGLILLLWFLVGLVVRTFRVPTTSGLILHTALVSTLVMSTYYGLDRSLLPVMAIAGLLLRQRYLEPGPIWPAPRPRDPVPS